MTRHPKNSSAELQGVCGCGFGIIFCLFVLSFSRLSKKFIPVTQTQMRQKLNACMNTGSEEQAWLFLATMSYSTIKRF